jgi:hypothetical protein
MEKYVKVPFKDYLRLEAKVSQLEFLNACGVDNWDCGCTPGEMGYNDDFSLDEEDIYYQIIEE